MAHGSDEPIMIGLAYNRCSCWCVARYAQVLGQGAEGLVTLAELPGCDQPVVAKLFTWEVTGALRSIIKEAAQSYLLGKMMPGAQSGCLGLAVVPSLHGFYLATFFRQAAMDAAELINRIAASSYWNQLKVCMRLSTSGH